MLTSLYLENFRAFGAATTIPLAPITLLFGENSSGKTSVLHALTLLKQTQEAGRSGPALALKGLVDFGSFADLVHDHGQQKRISIGIQYVSSLLASQKSTRSASRFTATESADPIRIQWTFGVDPEKKQLRLFGYEMEVLGQQSLCASYLNDGQEGTAGASVESNPCLAISRLSLSRQALQYALQEWVYLLPELTSVVGDHIQGREYHYEDLFSDDQPADEASKHEGQTRALRNYLHRLKRGYERRDVIRHAESAWGHVAFDRDGVVLWPKSILGEDHESDPAYIPGFIPADIRSRIFAIMPFNPLHLLGRAAVIADQIVRSTVAIGPFRQPATRVYVLSDISPHSVGRDGEWLTSMLVRNDSALKSANHWFERFDIGYVMRLRPLGGKVRSDLYELRLRDRRRKNAVEVAFNDVGFGISQMLPIIVQAVASEKKIITIEQPEVHIHPRLQAEIGDLLVETMQTNGHQFLVETHSEHLILRLRKLVRERKLKPEDLCVLHVSRGKQGAEVQRIHVGEDGSFLDEWPGGFFPERLRELT